MMKLYLIQHGQALSKEEDPERGLSEAGIADVRKVAALLQGKISPERVVHSGKKRARQTAEIFSGRLNISSMDEMLDLDPMADPGIWAAHVSVMSGSVMVVGHLPHLARLASLLLAGDANLDVVRFSNGGVVCLEREHESWTLRWMVTPELGPVNRP